MTVMASAPDMFDEDLGFTKEQLKQFVEAGVITKIDKHKEHYAIAPKFIPDPGEGVMQEIRASVLGKWDKKLQAYVVCVDNVRSTEGSAGMNEDHRWLHADILGTYYVYSPHVGQRLTGVIRKVGNDAAICEIFEVFNATVFAEDKTELATWAIGQELQFEVTSFVHRRKGPIIRGKSIQLELKVKKKGKIKKFEDEVTPTDQDWQEELENGQLDLDSTVEIAETSKSKKKKKKRKREEESMELEVAAEDERNALLLDSEFQSELLNNTIEISKKKKKKKRHSLE